jgi:hypothetical protein
LASILNDHDRARTREPFFFEALKRFVSKAEPVKHGCAYDFTDSLVLSQAYFLLNTAYKRDRLNEQRNTKLTKVAAIKMAAVMAVRPFFSASGENHEALFYLNPNFALLLAELVLGVDFLNKNPDHIRRFSMLLDDLRFPSLDRFLADAAEKREQHLDDYRIEALDELELRAIDLLVTMCELATGDA